MGGVTTRLGLRYPFLSDTADVPRDVTNLANDIDDAAIFGVGTLAARPVSASGTPGISGRFYYANDLGVNAGHLYFDFSQGWRKIPMYQTDGTLWMRGADTDTQPAIKITPSAYKIEFGPGGSGVVDWTLSRYTTGQGIIGGSPADGGVLIVQRVTTNDQIKLGGNTTATAAIHATANATTLALGVSTDFSSTKNFLTIDSSGNVTVDRQGTGAKLYFGSAADTWMNRFSAGTIQMNGDLWINNVLRQGGTAAQIYQIGAGSANQNWIVSYVTGDTQARYIITPDGTTFWGPGNAAQDVKLQRGQASQLWFNSQMASLVMGSGGYSVFGDANSNTTYFSSNIYFAKATSDWRLNSPSSGFPGWAVKLNMVADTFEIGRTPGSSSAAMTFTNFITMDNVGRVQFLHSGVGSVGIDSAGVRLGMGATGYTGNNLVMDNASSLPGVITGGGVIYVTSSTTLNFRASGNIVTVATSSPSDERLKTNLRPIESALDGLLALRAVKYNWNYGTDLTSDHVGLIAQEVQKRWPSVVSYGHFDHTRPHQEFKYIDYQRMVPILVAAIQDLAHHVGYTPATN